MTEGDRHLGTEGLAGPPPFTLRDYALIADGRRGAIVGPRGDVAWLCFPRWHDASVFTSLLGGAGTYVVGPRDRHVWGGYYEDGTLIWRSRWVTDDAIVECREALACPSRPDQAVLLRRIEVVDGAADMAVRLHPRAGYDRHGVDERHHVDGTWILRTGDVHLRLSASPAVALRSSEAGVSGWFQARAGDAVDLVLEVSTSAIGNRPVDPDRAWAATAQYWAEGQPTLRVRGAHRDARHAWAVMRGCTGAGTGTVAAVTTSLPERAEQGRNYDYRYVWLRDQCYIGRAAAYAGATDLLDDAVGFVAARLLADGPDLDPAYTVDGHVLAAEKSLDLPGYPGGAAVVGNHVNDQFQLDVPGEALLLFDAANREGRLTDDARHAAALAVDVIRQRWQAPDAGVWELDDRRWTHSRLACLAGLRRVPAIGLEAACDRRAAELADRLAEELRRHHRHPTGRWQRADDDDRIDAALLVGGLRGALAADDPATLATLDAVLQDLCVDELTYRYCNRDEPLGRSEGAFLLCGFWTSLALHQQGRDVEAVRWFERSRAACGPPGLLSEEFDVTERQNRGNLPQTFVHALLMECAATLPLDGPGAERA